MTSPVHARHPDHCACARCGYDLRGLLGDWSTSCPLDYQCPECGLCNPWGTLLSPKLRESSWYVEHGRGLISFVRRSFGTSLRYVHPWAFWSGVRMYHQLRWPRVVGQLIILALLTVLISALARFGIVNWWEWIQVQRGKPPTPVWSLIREIYWIDPEPDEWWPVLRPFLLVVLLCPFGFLTLPVTRRRAGVLPAHLVRIALHQIGVLILILLVFDVAVVIENDRFSRIDDLAMPLARLTCLAALVIWWATACRRYLELDHSWGIGVAIVAMSALMTAIGMTFWYLATHVGH